MGSNKIIIIGAGLAGLTAAIHLSKVGIAVTLIDKHSFPRHKVCGEYVSNEVLPYLKYLDIDIESVKPAHISKIEFSGANGKTMYGVLPLGGFGISRFTLDNHLFQKAIHNGCTFIEDTVSDIAFLDDRFAVTLASGPVLESDIVLGAFGKRSNVDQKMQRAFISKKSPWLAVKAHYDGEFPDDVVGLHNFAGGYCGVSKIENGQLNICYLADYRSFKKHRNITDFQRAVLCGNPKLRQIFSRSIMAFDAPLTISQISFEEKNAVENHVIMIGDSAGLIHPLCGNGMAMAMHSAKIAAELIIEYSAGALNRSELERKYTKLWNDNFSTRMTMGRVLATIFRSPTTASFLMGVMARFPAILQFIISKTHGKPIITGQ